jgi:hypothetical protein
VSDTQFDDGGGTETLNDTNLVATECSIRILFTDGSSVATSNGRFYTFDGTTVTDPAVDIEAYAFEQGVSATTWTEVNDYSNTTGGDNTDRSVSSDRAHLLRRNQRTTGKRRQQGFIRFWRGIDLLIEIMTC